MSDEKREWFAMNMSTNEIYDYAKGLEATVTDLRKLLRRCKKILEHAPEFPFYLIAKYDIEDLQDELAKAIEG